MKTILVYGMKNLIGGLENYLLNMQKELTSSLHFIYIIEKCDFIHEAAIHQLNGELVYISTRHPIMKYLKSLYITLRDKRKTIDVIYININHISFDFIVILIARILNYRVIVHSHNAMRESIDNTAYRVLHACLERVGLCIVWLFRVDRLAVSDRAGKFLFCNREFKVVSPGIESNRFTPDMTERRKIKAELHCENVKIVGFVGRLVNVKNPLYVLDVFREIRSKLKNTHLVIVGDGPMMREVQNKVVMLDIGHHVTMIGQTDEVNKYMQGFDVMLAPSLSEGLSLVTLEAQAAGIPIICAAGNFPEDVKVSPLVHFIPLEDKDRWINQAIDELKAEDFSVRMMWNEHFASCQFEQKQAAERLKKLFA